jgi:hypothetical protein
MSVWVWMLTRRLPVTACVVAVTLWAMALSVVVK